MNDTKYLIDDMRMYNKNLNEEKYENMNARDIMKEFSEYYDKNLPVDLLTWSRVNMPDKTLLYEKAFWEQVLLVRDKVNAIFYGSFEEYKNNPVYVINTHTSKSVKLPVYEINVKKYGLKIVLSNNFYEWNVSIISEVGVDMDIKGLFDDSKKVDAIYCSGFKKEQVFESFSKNKNQFTFEMEDTYKLYTFMYLINDYFKNLSLKKDNVAKKRKSNTDFENMSVPQAIRYCYENEDEFIKSLGTEGREQFDAIITLLEMDSLNPSELPDYGMDF